MKNNYHSTAETTFRNKAPNIYLILFLIGCMFQPLYSQQTYTFTPAGASGSLGPTQAQVNTAYAATNLSNNVTVIGVGAQVWTVPVTGMYRIEAYGAEGGTSSGVNPGANGGLGAIMQGDFSLTAGQTLTIVVGQKGGGSNYGGSGGGGSYVVTGNNVPLCVAGGGGGAIGYPGYSNGFFNGEPGLTTTTGGNANVMGGPTYGVQALGSGGGAPGFGGTNGYGGGSGVASGGGGFYGDGANGGTPTDPTYSGGGKAFVNGSSGGIGAQPTINSGGFGGGGGTQAASGYGAGGGGYSGGGGGSLLFSPSASGNGGGGGSFNSGTNQNNTAGANAGHGKVVIVELCNISLVANGTNPNGAICAGSTVTLTTNAVSNYSWNTGPTTSSLVVSPGVTTSYTLTAMSVSNCVTSAVITVTVDQAAPTLTVVNTANSGGICPGKTVTLTASGATTYTWTGGTAVTNGVSFAPATASDYTVNATNACGTASAVTSVSVHPLPNITPVASSSSLCSGGSVTLTGTGNSTNYVWSGFTSPISDGVGFSPIVTATYSVIGTSALSCTALATIPVTVVTTPILAPIAQPVYICLGGSSTLTANGATNYTWTSATQTVYTNTMVTTPTNTGSETFTVTKANANCVDTKMITIVTYSPPVVFAIATPTLVCSLNSSTLAVAGGQTYTWTAPNGNTFTGASPVVTPSATIVYTVAAHDGTCINTTTVLVATNPIPTISIVTSSSLICRGQSVTMTANGGINYTWTAVTGTTLSPTIVDTPTAPLVYTAKGDNMYGCTANATQIVLVNPNPTITVNVLKPLVCSGGLSTLTAMGASTYTWDANAGGATSASVVVTSTNSSSGFVTYSVAATNTNTGCQNTKTVQVNVFVPVLTVTGNTSTCEGGNISLVGTGGNNGSYSWNTGSGTSPGSSITRSLSAPAVFTLTAMTNSAAIVCPATKTVALGIYANPSITAVAEKTTICRAETVQLHGEGGVSYSWSNGATQPTITIGPVNQVQTLSYTVTGTDANGCVNTGTVQVKVSGCTGISEVSGIEAASVRVYPNPNNGQFVIETSADMNLVLSNELGQIVRTLVLSGSNSHTISVANLAEGIYFISGPGVNQKIIVTK